MITNGISGSKIRSVIYLTTFRIAHEPPALISSSAGCSAGTIIS
jgi:hypothetical protein